MGPQFRAAHPRSDQTLWCPNPQSPHTVSQWHGIGARRQRPHMHAAQSHVSHAGRRWEAFRAEAPAKRRQPTRGALGPPSHPRFCAHLVDGRQVIWAPGGRPPGSEPARLVERHAGTAHPAGEKDIRCSGWPCSAPEVVFWVFRVRAAHRLGVVQVQGHFRCRGWPCSAKLNLGNKNRR